MAFKVIIIVTELMFLGINVFLALLRAHLNPRHAWAKMILGRAKNIFIPANVNSVVVLTYPVRIAIGRTIHDDDYWIL